MSGKLLIIIFILCLFNLATLQIIPISLNSLYPSKIVHGAQLFPAHDSTVYPTFLETKAAGTAISYVQVPRRDTDALLYDLKKDGYLATAICGYRYLNDTFFVINAEKRPGTHFVDIEVSMETLQKRSHEFTDHRYDPIHICASPGGEVFTSIWHSHPGFLWHYTIQAGKVDSILEEDQQRKAEGYYPSTLQIFRNETANALQALAIWKKGYGVRYSLKKSLTLKELNGMALEEDYVISSLSVSPPPKSQIYEIRRNGGFSWRDRVIPREVEGRHQLEYVHAEVEHKIRQLEIPSLSIAVLQNGQPRHIVAYGYADLTELATATPSHLYRIASVSKTITSMAIQELINSGSVKLDTRVFGTTGILGTDFGFMPYNYFLLSITVQNLLEHSVGTWEHYRKYEFARKSLKTHKAFLGWLLDRHPPWVRVNRVFLYSNIGYILLGRIIEKISGSTYEKHVQETLFQELEINGRVGTRKRGENEVSYYSHDNANAYFNWDPVRMDAAAGWTLRAADVAKIFGHLEKHRWTRYRDVTQRSTWKPDYGRGIQIGWDGSLYHFGSLAGTEAIGFSKNGIQCALVANIRGQDENILTEWMLQFCQAITSKLTSE